MIQGIKIENFKCFDEFEIEDFGKVNIFLGANNVGKNTLLEAIFGYACGKNLSPLIENTILRLLRNNNQNLYSLTEKVLNTFNDKKKLQFVFEGKMENGRIEKHNYMVEPSSIFGEINASLINNSIPSDIMTVSVINQIPVKFFFNLKFQKNDEETIQRKVNFPLYANIPTLESPLLSAVRMDVNNFKDDNLITKIYSILKRDSKKLKIFINELNKSFKNNIEGIDMFPYPDGTPAPVSLKMKDQEFMPIYEFGDGMQKWFSVIGNQLIYRDSIHCIEEIGDMLHPEAQGNLGLNLSEMSALYNNQVFATTQSLEFVENYLETVRQEKEHYLKDIRIITLKKINGKVKARVLDGVKALDLLANNKVELR